MLCHLVKWLRPAALSALILKSDRIRHDNSVTRITYRLWGVSVDLGLGLPEVVAVWKREKKKRLFKDKSENNPPTWLPADMKKWNECCYYYLLHQWYIKHTSCRLTRRSWAHIPSLTDRKRHTDGEKSDAILKKNPSHTKEMSDIGGGGEKPWLHLCVESQHARAAGRLVNTQRLETDNFLFLVFSQESFCYPHIMIVKCYWYFLFFR